VTFTDISCEGKILAYIFTVVCTATATWFHHHHHHHHWLDSPWWALAFLRSFVHSSLLRATLFQFLTSNILMSWSTPTSHHSFGLPTLLTPSGLALNSHMISSLYFWNVKSDDGCLVQPKHVTFYFTIIKCWVLTDYFPVAYYKYYNKKSAGETAITHADIHRNQWSVILYINIK